MDLTIYDETDGQVSPAQLALVRDVLQFAARQLSLKDSTEMSVTMMTNPAIRKLNQQYRGVDRATDVLSFAAEESYHGSRAGSRASGEPGRPLRLD